MKYFKEKNQRESGQSLLIVALLIIIIVAFMGLVIDVGRLYLTREQLQAYTDAATLAGARKLPFGSETPSTMKEMLDAGVRTALETYARNVGVDVSTLPSPPYANNDYDPAWNPSDPTQENLKFVYDMAHGAPGSQETDTITITVLYNDELVQERELPKERTMLLESSREVSMIFGGLLGPPIARVSRPAAAFRGVFDVKWRYYSQADVHATPYYWVDRDTVEKVYTASRDGYIYCLDAWGDEETNTTWAYWKFKVLNGGNGQRTLGYPYQPKGALEPPVGGDRNRSPAIISSPKVVRTGSRDLVMFTSYPLSSDDPSYWGYLYALDSTTGEKVWARYVGQRKYHRGAYGYTYIDADPVFSPDGSVVYVGSRDGRLYAFAVEDGSDVWPDCDTGSLSDSCFDMTGGTVSSPVVDPTDGTIYIGTSKRKDGSGTGSPTTSRGVVHAVNPDGTEKWTWAPPRNGSGFDSSPELWPKNDPTTLYIGCHDKYLYSLDISGASPSKRWEYRPPSSLTAPDGVTGNPRSRISATPLVVEENGQIYVYFSTEYGGAFKIRDNGGSATKMWGTWLGYDINIQSIPPGPGGTYDGQKIERRAIHISPDIADNFVYFGIATIWNRECAFQALRKDTGKIYQSFVMENDTHSTLRVAANNWLYYASCDNYTYGVDTNPESFNSRLIR